MRQKLIITAIMALFFILFITVPVLAIAVTHTVNYDMDGVINFKKQAGHYCNTGAEIKQVITGSGKMDKTQTITMVKGKITMDDKNNWVAGATPLTVTTVWKLCAPPKYTYNADVIINGLGVDLNAGNHDIPVAESSIFGKFDMPATWHNRKNSAHNNNGLIGVTHEMLAEAFGWDAVSEQIWAVQVQANPGSAGNLQQNGNAAYGPYQAAGTVLDDHRRGSTLGKEYVGEFFNISQQSRVAQGVLRRYIDISSYKEHSYLHEDMSVTGTSYIKEAFSFSNYGAGADVTPKWYNLF